MKSKFLSITNNSPYDLVSAYLPCSVFCLSWSHLPPYQVPCAPVTWKDPHVQTRHTSPISMPPCPVPFHKVGPSPLSTCPMAPVMELLFLSACLSLPLVYEFLETRMMTPLLSSKTTVVPNIGQRLKKHLIAEWMGSRRILWSFNWSPLPSALL